MELKAQRGTDRHRDLQCHMVLVGRDAGPRGLGTQTVSAEAGYGPQGCSQRRDVCLMGVTKRQVVGQRSRGPSELRVWRGSPSVSLGAECWEWEWGQEGSA